MKTIEVLAKTEYQDVYRVTNGVLLVVNKFVPIEIDGVKCPTIHWTNRSNSKIYDKGCKKDLKRLTKEYKHEKTWGEIEWSVPVGTVVYENRPVVSTNNQAAWTYEVKTTGGALSGDFDTIEKLLNSILYVIRTGEIK